MDLHVQFDPALSAMFRDRFIEELDAERLGYEVRERAPAPGEMRAVDPPTWIELANFGMTSLGVLLVMIQMYLARQAAMRQCKLKVTHGETTLIYERLTREQIAELEERLRGEYAGATFEITLA